MMERVALGHALPGFEAYATEDVLGRRVLFYLSSVGSSRDDLPLAAYVQGSGCASLFRLDAAGRVLGRYQGLLLVAARGRARIVAVEKPGVAPFDDPEAPGTARHASAEFLAEHTLDRWAEAVGTAVRAASRLSQAQTRPLLLIGHSEGGIVAARVAVAHTSATHIALLSSPGPTQLFDLAACARARGQVRSERLGDAMAARVVQTYRHICLDPDSITRFAWGHPFRRWSTFLASSTFEELLASAAAVYIAHGAEDEVVPFTAAEMLHAELARRRRRVVLDRIPHAGHRIAAAGPTGPGEARNAFGRILDWFLVDPRYATAAVTQG